MPSNVNAGKKGSNAAKKPAARKPSASRSRTPNKMAGQSLGGLRGMQGMAPRPQQGTGGGMQMGGGFQTPMMGGGGGGWQGLQQQAGFNPNGNAFGNAMAARGGWQGMGGQQPQMSQPFQPPKPMFNGPFAGQGGGYGNAYGGPSAGGTQTIAQRPMAGGGMQQPGMGSFQTQAPVGPQGPTTFGGGPTAPRPTPQISQPFTPPPSGPQQPFTRGPGQITY